MSVRVVCVSLFVHPESSLAWKDIGLAVKGKLYIVETLGVNV